jgi:hypothetical protein
MNTEHIWIFNENLLTIQVHLKIRLSNTKAQLMEMPIRDIMVEHPARKCLQLMQEFSQRQREKLETMETQLIEARKTTL